MREELKKVTYGSTEPGQADEAGMPMAASSSLSDDLRDSLVGLGREIPESAYASSYSKGSEPIEVLGELPAGTASVFMTTCSLVNVMIGAGVLAFPAQFARAGWYTAPPMLILVAIVMAEVGFVTSDALQRIEEMASSGREFSFGMQATKMEDLGEAAFGERGMYFVSIATNVFFLFLCGAFLILIGGNMQILVENKIPYRVWVLVMLAIATPVTLLQDISLIAKASVVGVGCSFVYVFSIVYSGAIVGAETPPTYRSLPETWTGLGSVFAVMMFGFMYVMVLPPLRASMREKEKMPQAVKGAMLVVLVIYSSCGFCGYYGWGNDVKGNVVASMGMPFDKIMALAVVANLMVTFPLIMSCVCSAFEAMLFVSYSSTVRVALVATTALVGLFCPFFMEVVSLLASFLGVLVGIVVPIICYWQLCPKDDKDHNAMGKVTWHFMILVIAGLVCFFGVSDSIADLRDAFKRGGKSPFTWEGFFGFSE